MPSERHTCGFDTVYMCFVVCIAMGAMGMPIGLMGFAAIMFVSCEPCSAPLWGGRHLTGG